MIYNIGQTLEYKEFIGKIVDILKNNDGTILLYGNVKNINNIVITFTGTSENIEKEFQKSIDDYIEFLEFCKKTYKNNISLSLKDLRFIIEAIEHYINHHQQELKMIENDENKASNLGNDIKFLELLQVHLKNYLK